MLFLDNEKNGPHCITYEEHMSRAVTIPPKHNDRRQFVIFVSLLSIALRIHVYFVNSTRVFCSDLFDSTTAKQNEDVTWLYGLQNQSKKWHDIDTEFVGKYILGT